MSHHPSYKEGSFRCPHCSVVATMQWLTNGTLTPQWDMETSKCAGCGECVVWFIPRQARNPRDAKAGAKIIYPLTNSSVDEPSSDMPDKVKALYEEAALVLPHSPRASAALNRLALQLLLVELGQPGKNINKEIASLVEQGLPPKIQKAMDILRVVGNNAVHPGQIDVNDSPDVAYALFSMLNLIVEDRITTPRQVDELFDSLPSGALDAINRRDK